RGHGRAPLRSPALAHTGRPPRDPPRGAQEHPRGRRRRRVHRSPESHGDLRRRGQRDGRDRHAGGESSARLDERHARPRRASHPGIHVRLERRRRARDAQRWAVRPLGPRALSRADRSPPVARGRRPVPRLPSRSRRRHRGGGAGETVMSVPLLTMSVSREQDVVEVRQRARQVAELLGFDTQDQTRVATAVSELARNAFSYGRGGRVEFLVEGPRSPQLLVVRISDRGPGIADVDLVLSGQYRSSTGMGLGMSGARRLVDRFEVTSAPGQGTTVTIGKLFPRRAPVLEPATAAVLVERPGRAAPQSALAEVRQQNQELLVALELVQERQQDLVRLTAELEDTNRGVVALYAELDEKADTLRRADDLKSRFLSNMSHEFRTPLNSMLALSALLLDDREHPLSSEQRRQVGYIRQVAEDLSELVN